jgi:hypothetical protein|tara:strand:+ start:200 stop:598 length:399 start_codon:yes stop_codon:yes gene_type:complete
MIAKGFAIQKVLKNGKLIDEQGIMGEFNNKEGAKIVEVSDGKAKYTELTPGDIMKLISRPASNESLERRIVMLGTRKHHRRHRHHRHHHSRGVASGHHTKKHHRRRRRKKKKRTHKHKRHHKRSNTKRHRRK